MMRITKQKKANAVRRLSNVFFIQINKVFPKQIARLSATAQSVIKLMGCCKTVISHTSPLLDKKRHYFKFSCLHLATKNLSEK